MLMAKAVNHHLNMHDGQVVVTIITIIIITISMICYHIIYHYHKLHYHSEHCDHTNNKE